MEVEFQLYVSHPLPNDPELAALEFWKGIVQQLPTLSEVALFILGIPVTSASVERSFSITVSYKSSTQYGQVRFTDGNVF